MKSIAIFVFPLLLTEAQCEESKSSVQQSESVNSVSAHIREVPDDIRYLYTNVEYLLHSGSIAVNSADDCLALSDPLDKGYSLAVKFSKFAVNSGDALFDSINSLLECNNAAENKQVGCFTQELGFLRSQMHNLLSDLTTYVNHFSDIYKTLVSDLRKCLAV